ncbi:MAG: hypothetical protein ABIM64_02965 [candidate division WOR-3 bacterium]
MNLFPLSLTMDKENIKILGMNLNEINSFTKIENSYDLVKNLEKILNTFFGNITLPQNPFPQNLFIIGEKSKLHLGKNIKVEGLTIINLTKGDVFISDNTVLKNFNSIEGPVFIGEGNLIDSATIRGPFVSGKVCKLSGEIEESIFFDYVNKHHYGFIGHSIICNWVNLGAGTTNSDLKNNYSTIRIFNGEDFVDSGMQKLGCIIGEHVKTAIGTMINTGTVIGPFSNIFLDIRNKKYIKPFSWGDDSNIYNIEKLVLDIKKVMARRNETPSENYIERVKNLYTIYSSGLSS